MYNTLCQTVLRRFLSKAKYNGRKHRQMSVTMTKDKSLEIHIGEIIIKSGDC